MFNAAITAANDRSDPKHLERSYQLFVSSCYSDPTYGQAFYQLGNNNADLKRSHAAIAAWRRALECETADDERARLLTNMGWTLYTMGNADEALAVSLQAVKLAPYGAPAHQNLSVIYQLLDDGDKMLASAKQAYALDPANVQNEIALAFALMFTGDFENGLRHFEKRFEWRLQQYLHSPYAQWQGEEGKMLYLMSDQGLGDTLSFARFVEQAAKRCQFIHASVHPELMRLLAHAFLHIKNINLIPQPQPFPQADYWTTFMSLPAAMKLNNDEIVNAPHIACSHFEMASGWWKVPDRKLHIGIAWKGNALSDIDKHRSIPVELFLELYRVPGIQLYSLQVDANSEDLYQSASGGLIRDLKPYIRDVADSVAMMQHLDMVICLESALGHICGLAGKECWLPYSYQGRDYRAGLRGEQPIWYPKHRFFRQEKDETWFPVFERINQALREKLSGRAYERRGDLFVDHERHRGTGR